MEVWGRFNGLRVLKGGGGGGRAGADYRCSFPFSKGCFKQLLSDIRTNAITVGGVAAGIGGLEVRG